MSLKTPLFLILIVSALCLGIFFIWPDFQKISPKQAELETRQRMAENIKEKNANMNSLIASLNDEKNMNQKEFVFNYIPTEKKEELIFNSLSRMANSDDSKVFLGNLALEVQKPEAVTVVQEMPQSSQDVLFGSDAAADGTLAPSSPLPAERKIKAAVLVLGKYENIKRFIEKLYALDMLKSIDSVSLTGTKDDNGNATDNVSADLTVNFRFLPEAKINNDYNSPIFGKKSFNFAVVDEVRAMLSQKTEAVTVEGIGRNNPFLP